MLHRSRPRRRALRAAGRATAPRCEGLERRLTLSATPAGVDVVSASTADSQSVAVDYQIHGAAPTQPFVVAVYRAAGPTHAAGDRLIGGVTVAPTEGAGEHAVNIPIAGGLPPDPAQPYVVAVADPNGTAGVSDPAHDQASFRTYVLGVVVHGGIQESSQRPLWEMKLARMLRGAGYDDVIAFNWASQSSTPGDAVKQGPRLAQAIRAASEAFPAGAPVDLHLIAHSEGAVVASQALLGLQRRTTPQLAAGYTKVTLLDPHPANNAAPGGQISTASGLAGSFARWVFRRYQAAANDPPVVIPPTVADTEVYYQHTPVSLDGANHGLYNLWGEVPVVGRAQYADLTGPKMAHSGGNGVQVWYAFHVVPTLHDGGNTFVDPTRVSAARVGGDTSPGGVTNEPTGAANDYGGTAAPGAVITLLARGGSTGATVRLGGAVADAAGAWSVDGRALPAGAYRVFARVSAPEGMPSPRARLIHAVPVDRVTVGRP